MAPRTNRKTNPVWLNATALAGNQRKLGKLLGLTQGQITRYLYGKNLPTPKIALKLERALGISKHLLRPDLFKAPEGYSGGMFVDSSVEDELALKPLWRAIAIVSERGLGHMCSDDVWITILASEVGRLAAEVQRLKGEREGS